MTGMRLNAGCGRDVREGWVNLDARPLPGVDVIHDLETRPLPFDDSAFEEILARDILEHVEYVPVLKEFHRILCRGGVLRIRVPHFTSENAYVDPTHERFFSIRTFEFFVKDSPFGRDYYFDFAFESLRLRRISFQKGVLLYNHLVEPLVNCAERLQNLWESTGASRLFPGENVIVELVK